VPTCPTKTTVTRRGRDSRDNHAVADRRAPRGVIESLLVYSLTERSGLRTKPTRRVVSSESGLTLVELMIVTIIVSILAGMATVSYMSYIRRSRSAEASTMLLTIGAREEAYRQEFGQYCGAGRSDGMAPTTVGVNNSWPSDAPRNGSVPFVNTSLPREWTQLGFRPDGTVRYRYVVVAGAPPVAPPGVGDWSSNPNQDLWYVAEAYGDLDADNTVSTYRLFSGNGNSLAITLPLE